MSLETWKEEFYPTDADSPEAEADPINHSLRKWKGLRSEAIERHSVTINSGRRYLLDPDTGMDMIHLGNDTCALCSVNTPVGGPVPNCNTCVLTKVRGVACDEELNEDDSSPWREWISYKNPEPMIQLLERAKEMEMKCQN